MSIFSRGFARVFFMMIVIGSMIVPAGSFADPDSSACIGRVWAGPAAPDSMRCSGQAPAWEELTVLTLTASTIGVLAGSVTATMTYEGFAKGSLTCGSGTVVGGPATCSATRIIGPAQDGTDFKCWATGIGAGTFSCSASRGGPVPRPGGGTFDPDFSGSYREDFCQTDGPITCSTDASASPTGALTGSFLMEMPASPPGPWGVAFGYSEVQVPYRLDSDAYFLELTVDLHLNEANSSLGRVSQPSNAETFLVGRAYEPECESCLLLARSVLTSTDGTTQRSNEDLQVTVVLRRADGTILPQGDYLIRVGMNAAGQLESFNDPPGTTDGNVLSGSFDVVINSITLA